MKTLELAKDFIASKRYKIIEESNDSLHIAFRYQLNNIYFQADGADENFFYLTLPDLEDVTEENFEQIQKRCNHLNSRCKMVKFYIHNGIIMASAEMFYHTKKEFMFQIKNALDQLVAAKIVYMKHKE